MASNTLADGGDDAPNYQLRGVEQVSPNSGTKRYIPDSPSSLTPAEGMLFDTVDVAYNFYKAYAEAGGWTEGQKEFRPVDTLAEQPSDRWVRRVPSKRTGCQAAIRIKLTDAKKYLLYHFTEAHNHDFVHEEDLHLLKENLGINRAHEEMINKMSNLNIGPARAFNIMKEVYGGFDKVGATKVDFKNFKKELNLFIGEFDAEMFVKRLMRKKEFLPNFSCEYETTDEGVLKYNMMFVPFTGIDNHNRNVTLGAAILGSETAERYSWLLKAIKNAYGYAPPVIVTNQDPAMKRAIADVWPESRHRLCMWHIMDKLTTKVGAALCANTYFRKRLSAVVWTDSLLPEAFETEWADILNDFGLTDHEWLTYIYGLRESWIPAYYRDEEMSAIEAQRLEHRKNVHDTRYTNPEEWSDFVLEKQAIQIYTRTIFFDVQLEIQHAIHRCTSVRLDHVGDFIKFFIKDLDQPCSPFFEVMIREEDVTVKWFEQFGLLCRHIFCVLRILGVREFPKQYILRHWTREAVPNSSPGSILTDGGDPDRSEEVNRCVHEISHATEVTCWKYTVAVPEAGASQNAEGNDATIAEGDADTVVEGNGPGSNDADDVFYTSGNDADMDDEDMAE
ncbi:protein FAR1-RELATED SEQUENCE 5-like [Helianthus annuus]|uniref:protein FAR1-RELATED SEQUENCE 5-like n=1 Tax=Helianthus annuus TaxID=4232 RepID=UPI001652EE57|nr:protein FAR1-RELATED SEQUENCE 5-like [Helianthus annuus]